MSTCIFIQYTAKKRKYHISYYIESKVVNAMLDNVHCSPRLPTEICVHLQLSISKHLPNMHQSILECSFQMKWFVCVSMYIYIYIHM